MKSADSKTLCPSANSQWTDARVFGVVGGTPDAPETVYLAKPQPISEDLRRQALPVEPEEVFRIAAPCAGGACSHFSAADSKCKLVAKTVRWIPRVVEQLPPCPIRPTCRWWKQEGKEACFRCPQVVTHNFTPTETMRDAANPALD